MMGLSLIFSNELPKGANNFAADTTEPPDMLENICHDKHLWKLTRPARAVVGPQDKQVITHYVSPTLLVVACVPVHPAITALLRGLVRKKETPYETVG